MRLAGPALALLAIESCVDDYAFVELQCVPFYADKRGGARIRARVG